MVRHISVARVGLWGVMLCLTMASALPQELALQPALTLPDSEQLRESAPDFESGRGALPAPPETEVVGFVLRGKRTWERMSVQDMDVLLVAPGRRLLPLFRLLEALQLDKTVDGNTVTFQPEGSPKIVLDTAGKQMQLGGPAKPVELVVALSEVTRQTEVYLSPDAVSEAFGMQLEWDSQEYEFVAQTSRKLGIWRIARGPSLLSIRAQELPGNVPEALPAAHPGRYSLDFMELRLESKLYAVEKKLGLGSARETFWGRLADGNYKLRLRHPSWYLWGDQTQSTDEPPVMLDWFDWTYRGPNSEITLGDSVFGLNELTFPLTRIFGVRFNGLTGLTSTEQEQDRSSLGLQDYFIRPHVFEGYAPAGSTVKLIINGMAIDTQDVIADPSAPPGSGTYRFDDIRLPPGTLNDVRIVITEPNGVQTEIERHLVESPMLLPAGRMAYVGAVGTNRDTTRWGAAGGLFAGRVLYGLTNRLTVGGTWAYQQDFYRRFIRGFNTAEYRRYPASSMHAGAQFAWGALDSLVVSGDVAMSTGPGADAAVAGEASYSGVAAKLKADYYPTSSLRLHSELFRYEPGFFDGENVELHDRQGYGFSGQWQVHPKWTVSSGIGRVANNVSGDLDETLVADFQHMAVTSRAIPRTSATLEVDRMTGSWDDKPKAIYRLKVLATPLQDLDIFADIATGDSLAPKANPNFFSGIALPGLYPYQSASTYVSATKSLSESNDVGVAYRKSGNLERPSVFHVLRTRGPHTIQIRTELGYDMGSLDQDSGGSKCYFENRSEYFLDTSGRVRLGLEARLESGEWMASLFLTLNELFCFQRNHLVLASDPKISPDRGGVQGRVFADYNANARMDPDEPGLSNVGVILGSLYNVLTDKDGYFVLTSLTLSKKVRVSLQMDTVPATFSPTHGTQVAYVIPGSLTEVNLGVMPVIAILGTVLAKDANMQTKPLPGIRVFLTAQADNRHTGDSVTASDGSYYLGDVRPGKYVLRVDARTVPKKWVIADRERAIEIVPKREPQEVQLPAFEATSAPTTVVEDVAAGQKP
jgi:hypothetical protein